MNTDIEKFLRKASQFAPPAGLKERLIEQIPARGARNMSRKGTAMAISGGWLRRWWPALAPAAASIACAAVLTARQGEIRELKASNEALAQATAEANTAKANNVVAAAPSDTSNQMQQEIDRLKEVAAQLKTEITQLSQLQTDNVNLRAQLAAPQETGLTAEETEKLAKARERYQSIQCVNNLKQFGVAVRVWALDNNDSNPPDILSMSNELSAPKILVCPADTSRQPATDWSSFTMANCSYEFLTAGEKEADREPQRVSIRCPIHGNIGMCDGSVMQRVTKDHPDWLVSRNGKIYFERPQQEIAPPPGMTEEQRKMYQQRYGIVPPNGQAPQ